MRNVGEKALMPYTSRDDPDERACASGQSDMSILFSSAYAIIFIDSVSGQ